MTDALPAPGFVLPERPAAQRERSVAAWVEPTGSAATAVGVAVIW